FDYRVLLDTDAFFRSVISASEFQRTMSSAEFHHLAGKYVRSREEKLGLKRRSLLAAAYDFGVPVYTSSPGDSSIGLNVDGRALGRDAGRGGELGQDRPRSTTRHGDLLRGLDDWLAAAHGLRACAPCATQAQATLRSAHAAPGRSQAGVPHDRPRDGGGLEA